MTDEGTEEDPIAKTTIYNQKFEFYEAFVFNNIAEEEAGKEKEAEKEVKAQRKLKIPSRDVNENGLVHLKFSESIVSLQE